MTVVLLPPRAAWHDRFLLKIAHLSQTWPLALTATIVGVMECVVNLWQFAKQSDLKKQNKLRRQLWIDQAKAAAIPGQTRVAIITGGNTGLGYETAKALVEAGYTVVIACRSIGKGQEALDRIEAETGIKGKGSVLPLDLSSQESVKAFVREFKALNFPQLDVLVNNAGLMDIPFGVTKEGYELQFGVNHLGHYVLTLELLPLLNKSVQGRIVVLSSNAMYSSSEIRYDWLQSSENYSRLGHYSYSKLANMLFVKALDRRLREQTPFSKVTVNAAHPGVCATELFRHNPAMNLLMKPASVVFRSPQWGAATSMYLALSTEGLDNVSGEFFFDQIPRSVNPIAEDKAQQELFWKKSVEFTGVDFKL
ncbi:hypothetical protein EDD11_010366 [Mortierella claussenii]|nr:hypothetical protein EDD11_010366 [Mortierella claussenii]